MYAFESPARTWLGYRSKGSFVDSFQIGDCAFPGSAEAHHVRGISVLRIVTADGNFDTDIPIDVEVNEIPF